MTRKGRRLTLISCALAVVAVAVGLGLYAMRDGVVFFVTPGELAARNLPPNTRLRIGGLVKPGSVERADARHVAFVIADNQGEVKVNYTGLLPDLFREGQGVVAEGLLVGTQFNADSVLAKHDENYMPRELADSLKKQGVWQHTGDAAATAGSTPAAAPAK
ncbi:MAG: cytochrome c maturation protein CcmE [Beijerinckiaceae bacterium]|nr:cytochrome c maturation protein CcmE [Beijerinckiaceae bacterium]